MAVCHARLYGHFGNSAAWYWKLGSGFDRAQLLMLSIIIALCMWSAWLIR